MKKFQVSQLVSDSCKKLFDYKHRSYKPKSNDNTIRLELSMFDFLPKPLPILALTLEIRKPSPKFSKSRVYTDDYYIVVKFSNKADFKSKLPESEDEFYELIKEANLCDYLEESPDELQFSVSEAATSSYAYFEKDCSVYVEDIKSSLHKLGFEEEDYTIAFKADAIRVYSSKYARISKYFGVLKGNISRQAVQPGVIKSNLQQISMFRGDNLDWKYVSYHYWDGCYRYMISTPEVIYTDILSLYKHADNYHYVAELIDCCYKY